VPYPHVRTTLIKLHEHNLKLAIVSDAPRLSAWIRLAEMNLTDFFDVVITLGESKKFKPFPNSFRKALRGLDMNPGEVLFVGDNPDRDVKGAKALGMKSCLARYGQVFVNEDIKADYEINNIEELVKIIEKENSN
jgi:putative hydrolase of the HAD superfamily